MLVPSPPDAYIAVKHNHIQEPVDNITRDMRRKQTNKDGSLMPQPSWVSLS